SLPASHTPLVRSLRAPSLYAFSHATPPPPFASHRFALRLVPPKNRFALLLEMLCLYALSDAKPLRTFAGNAMSLRIIPRKNASHFCWKCFVSTHYPTHNRFALFLEMLCLYALSYAKPLRTFAGNALSLRIIPRKTASHFCWKCYVSTHYPTQNRFALLLEMLCLYALSHAKTATHFCWKCYVSTHCPTQNRCALLLEMLCLYALSHAKTLRTLVVSHQVV